MKRVVAAIATILVSAEGATCPDGTTSPPVHLQFSALFDMAAFQTDFAAYREDIMTVISQLEQNFGSVEVESYAFTNRPNVGSPPSEVFAGKKINSFESPLTALPKIQEVLSQGLKERPITDIDDATTVLMYSSLFDSIYHSVASSSWSLDPLTADNKPIVKIFHIASDIPSWFGGKTGYETLPGITEDIAKQHADPNAYYTTVDFPTSVDFAPLATAKKIPTEFIFQSIFQNGYIGVGSEYLAQDVGDWFRIDLVENMFGPTNYVAEYEAGTDMVGVIMQDVTAAVCSAVQRVKCDGRALASAIVAANISPV